jgi:hypothetical protein
LNYSTGSSTRGAYPGKSRASAAATCPAGPVSLRDRPAARPIPVQFKRLRQAAETIQHGLRQAAELEAADFGGHALRACLSGW